MGRGKGKGRKRDWKNKSSNDLDADQDTTDTKKESVKAEQNGSAASSGEPLQYLGDSDRSHYVKWKDLKIVKWVVGIIISISLFVYYIAEYKTNIDTSISNAQSDINKLEKTTDALKEKSIRHDSRINNIEKDLTKLDNQMKNTRSKPPAPKK